MHFNWGLGRQPGSQAAEQRHSAEQVAYAAHPSNDVSHAVCKSSVPSCLTRPAHDDSHALCPCTGTLLPASGGRLDPSRVRVVDLFATYNDPFATNLRKGLRREGISGGIVAVWSDEPVQYASLALTQQRYKKSFYGTISYVPA